MNKFLTYIIFYLLLTSCNSFKANEFENVEYRNENYLWFEGNKEIEGKWIKINNQAKPVKDGRVTLFYSNGAIREKYRVDEFGQSDTINYFNLEGKLTHQSVESNNSISNIYLIDGPLSVYLFDGSEILKGNVKGNKLNNYTISPPLKEYFLIVKGQHESNLALEFLYKIHEDIMSQNKEISNDFIFNYLEKSNTYTSKIDSIIVTLEQIETRAELLDFKNSTAELLMEFKSFINKEMVTFLELLRDQGEAIKDQHLFWMNFKSKMENFYYLENQMNKHNLNAIMDLQLPVFYKEILNKELKTTTNKS